MGSELGTEGWAGTDRPAYRVWAEGRKAARALRLMGAGSPAAGGMGCRHPLAEPTHGCRLAFTRARGPFRGQRPRVQAREGRSASLGALPNAFATHCVPSLCQPGMTRTVSRLPRAPRPPQQQPHGAIWPALRKDSRVRLQP